VRRYGRGPREGARETALRFYAVPHAVLDDVDAELIARLEPDGAPDHLLDRLPGSPAGPGDHRALR